MSKYNMLQCEGGLWFVKNIIYMFWQILYQRNVKCLGKNLENYLLIMCQVQGKLSVIFQFCSVSDEWRYHTNYASLTQELDKKITYILVHNT